jgi:glycosyltransferase involved in cell wall biosynthesis
MKPRLCFVVSAPMTAVAFLNGHIDYLSSDYEMTVVCNFDGTEKDISKNAQLKNIRIARKISAISDLRAVYSLARFLKKGNFQIVHSVTPKAGLITAMAGWLAKTPIRIHWFTGQVWVLKSGVQRRALKNLDRLVAKLNTSVLVDSPSQRDFLIEQGVISPAKSQVLGSGSIAGVDTERFRPNPEVRVVTRAELGIEDPNAPIILFVGRLNHDKGIDTLLQAFSSQTIQQDLYLLLVGPDEENYTPRIPELLGERLENFRYIPFTTEPEKYMAASDIFCLPSLREGFGLAIIEAGSSGLPSVASGIYGVTDSVKEGETGLLIRPGSVDELIGGLTRLLKNPGFRLEMGANARKRVQNLWQIQLLQKSLSDYYAIQVVLSGRK